MKQPYTYTMPESFIKDANVPARWRVLGVLNGFFINGMKFWGSNEWIGEKIGAHKDTVSQGIKELEELGLIRCDRTRRTRVVYDNKTEIGTNAYLRPVPTPISDRRQRLTNADSNADRDNLVAEATENVLPIVVVADTPPTKPKNKDHLEIKSVFRLFGKDCYERIGIRKQEYEAARYLLDKYGMEKIENAMKYVRENEGTEHFYTVDTPYELRLKWVKLSKHKSRNGN